MEMQDNLQEADGNKEENNKGHDLKKKSALSNKIPTKETNLEDKKNVVETVVEAYADYPQETAIKYEDLDIDSLVKSFENLLKNKDLYAIRSQVNRIKKAFNNKFNSLLTTNKETFLAEGGNSIDFNFSSPHKKKFNALSRSFRERNERFEKNRILEYKKNLEARLQIIEEIKGLIDDNQNSNTTYNAFKNLQGQWRNLGKVPAKDANNVWNNYRHHVERFYDFLHLDRDLRDRDYKYNLEKKQKLIENAEALATEENLGRAFRELQALHKIWKDELGPVAKEYREKLWEQFAAATKVINDKRKVYNVQIEEELLANYKSKEILISKINEIANSEFKTHSDWQKQIKAIEQLRERFFNLGSVPKKLRNKSWADFKSGVRMFNKNKNKFYKFLKKTQSENLKKKKELVEIALQNKDSEDFETTAVLIKNIQSQWKSIGHIPRKESNKLWKEFRAACNHFFDRYHQQKNAGTPEEKEAFVQKEKLFETLRLFTKGDDKKTDINTLKTYSKQWADVGNVPKNKRQIDRDFSKSINSLLMDVGVSESEMKHLKYRNKLQEISKNSKALNNEMGFVKKKIEEIKSEMNQLENNLQFFSNIKDDNPMVVDVNNKIKSYKSQLMDWNQKLISIKKVVQ